MQPRELIAIIKSHRRDSLGADDGALSNERAKAMDRYHGRPYGNEEEGRSAVVSRDLSETVDWAMPAIMRVFTQSGNVAEFDPVGPEDEELAQQESDAINQVVMKENNGFLVLHDAVKDALLLKNGYTKQWWDEAEETTEERYTGLSIGELTMLMGDLEAYGAKVEVKGQEAKEIQGPEGPMQVFDVALSITRKCSRVRTEAVPCEEIRISRRCRGAVDTSPFVEHVTRKTRTELIEMGMPRDFVDSLPSLSSEDNSNEKFARDSVTDESDEMDVSVNDRSMDEIEYCEAFLRVDFDGDGIAELRKVVTVADKIPPGDEWNEMIDFIPITGGVPKRVPHRHVGESLADELEDLSEIKTTLERQALDNIYATNNAQWLVNERVNLPDFLTSLPGGVKRVRGVDPIGDSAQAVMATPVLNQILPAIDYFDRVKETRTGISQATTGLDPDILKQSTKGAFIENLNRASQKIEMITRMLAETLVKPMMLQVHALMIKHQDKPKMMKLRGKFVEVNPQEWRNRTDLTIKVGLGTGSQEEQREKLMIAAQVQEKTAALGLVGPQEGYNLAVDLYKALGFDMPDKYAINPDPANPAWQQQQQQMGSRKDPLVQAEEVKGQATLQKAQMDMQGEARLNEQKAQLERERMQMEMAAKERDAERQAELEKYKAQLNASVELEKERIRATYSVDAARAANPNILDMSRADEMDARHGEVANQLASVVEALKGVLADMDAPLEIVRGPDGKVAGGRKGSRVINLVRN